MPILRAKEGAGGGGPAWIVLRRYLQPPSPSRAIPYSRAYAGCSKSANHGDMIGRSCSLGMRLERDQKLKVGATIQDSANSRRRCPFLFGQCAGISIMAGSSTLEPIRGRPGASVRCASPRNLQLQGPRQLNRPLARLLCRPLSLQIGCTSRNTIHHTSPSSWETLHLSLERPTLSCR
jgi:hypothetical protein